MRPNLLNKFRGILLLKSPLNGRGSGSIQEVLELRGIKTRTGFLNARQIAMPQDGTDARKTVVKILNQMLHRLLLKSTCRNAQRPEESCQYGYCKLENLIPFLLVLFCHNLFCFKRLITEVSHVGKLREVREVRGKLRDKCPKFKLEDYCLLTSRTTVGSDNFFNSFNF